MVAIYLLMLYCGIIIKKKKRLQKAIHSGGFEKNISVMG
jgi:hypothetical protein